MQATPIIHYVNCPVLSMHADLDQKSELLSQAIYGTAVKVLQNVMGWVKIETPDGYSGWCRKEGLKCRVTPYPSLKSVAKVDTIWTHLFSVDDITTRPPVMRIPYGTELEIEEIVSDRWMKVRILDNQVLFAQRDDFRLNRDLLPLSEILNESTKFLGLPYLWGGNSSFGFDCSGFVQTLFKQAGIQLPRNSQLQANWDKLKIVQEKDLKAGDLLFFGKAKDKITHVGLYFGKDRFIHSVAGNRTGPKTIQISRLDDEWYPKFVLAKRVLN